MHGVSPVVRVPSTGSAHAARVCVGSRARGLERSRRVAPRSGLADGGLPDGDPEERYDLFLCNFLDPEN